VAHSIQNVDVDQVTIDFIAIQAHCIVTICTTEHFKISQEPNSLEEIIKDNFFPFYKVLTYQLWTFLER